MNSKVKIGNDLGRREELGRVETGCAVEESASCCGRIAKRWNGSGNPMAFGRSLGQHNYASFLQSGLGVSNFWSGPPNLTSGPLIREIHPGRKLMRIVCAKVSAFPRISTRLYITNNWQAAKPAPTLMGGTIFLCRRTWDRASESPGWCPGIGDW
jgi:hypothetical protein